MNSRIMAVPCSFLLRKPTASAHPAWVEQLLLTLLPTCPGDSTWLADSSRQLKASLCPWPFSPSLLSLGYKQGLSRHLSPPNASILSTLEQTVETSTYLPTDTLLWERKSSQHTGNIVTSLCDDRPLYKSSIYIRFSLLCLSLV